MKPPGGQRGGGEILYWYFWSRVCCAEKGGERWWAAHLCGNGDVVWAGSLREVGLWVWRSLSNWVNGENGFFSSCQLGPLAPVYAVVTPNAKNQGNSAKWIQCLPVSPSICYLADRHMFWPLTAEPKWKVLSLRGLLSQPPHQPSWLAFLFHPSTTSRFK